MCVVSVCRYEYMGVAVSQFFSPCFSLSASALPRFTAAVAAAAAAVATAAAFVFPRGVRTHTGTCR